MKETYAGSGQVRFEYRHLAFLGPESVRAAEASECANEQGQFWQYHDTLFANQLGENLGAFSDPSLKTFAAALGLDQDAFDDCLDSNRHRAVVNEDSAEASERGVSSTPTIFINGQLIPGVTAFEEIQPIVESQLLR